MSSIWKIGGGSRKEEAEGGKKAKKSKKEDKKSKKEKAKTSKTKSSQDDFVLSGPTNAQHLGHMGFDRKNGFEVRNLPPEWEALFKGLNETLKSLGAHGVTKKEAQMLFAMASDALIPGAAAAATAVQTEKQRKEEARKTMNPSMSDSLKKDKDFENLMRERDALTKQRDDLLREREVWVKNKQAADRVHDENQQLFHQLQEEKKHRVQFENENTQLTQRLRILDFEIGQLKSQLSSRSSDESQSKRRDAEMLDMMAKHEAVVQRKEQELTYEREYRSQLQVEKIELENQMAQLRAELLALKAQDINPSTALQEAKQIFDMELEGVKKRLEDDMNQTKQLLAYEQQCRAFYENASREKEREVVQLRLQLEEQQSKEGSGLEEEKARLQEELKNQQMSSASETQKLLDKLKESSERTLALERQLKEAQDSLKAELRNKEEYYESALKEKDDQLSELRAQLQQQVTVHEGGAAAPAFTPAPPPMPPPGPPPPGPPPSHAPSAPSAPPAPAAPAPPPANNAFEAGSRDALLAAIKNPVLLKPVEAGKKEEKRDIAAEDGNVLNIIARALLARRAAIKDDELEPEEDLWE